MNWHQRLTQAREAKNIKKSAFAKMAGVSAPTVTDWENGDTKMIEGANLIKVCSILGIRPEWLLRGEGEGPHSTEPTILAVHPDDEQREDVIYVPESKIEFSAGNGRTANYELVEDGEPASYRLSWFQKYGINPTRVRRFRVAGDSMEPMLYARDTILVNQDETNIIDGKLYAIRYGDELRVKFLSRRLDGTLILRSANPNYKDEEITPEMANEHISVIGRVRDKSGTGGL